MNRHTTLEIMKNLKTAPDCFNNFIIEMAGSYHIFTFSDENENGFYLIKSDVKGYFKTVKEAKTALQDYYYNTVKKSFVAGLSTFDNLYEQATVDGLEDTLIATMQHHIYNDFGTTTLELYKNSDRYHCLKINYNDEKSVVGLFSLDNERKWRLDT